MKIKLLGMLALVILGSLVGCSASTIEDRHNLEENYRFDEFSHWKHCDGLECLLEEPYPKYLEGSHNFVADGEPLLRHVIGSRDYTIQYYKCSVCDYRKSDAPVYLDTPIYGSFDNPAAVEDMPHDYMKNNITFNSLSKTDFPEFEDRTLYAYYDLEEPGYLFIKEALAHKQSEMHTSTLEVRGDFSVYNSSGELIELPRCYSFVTGETNNAFDRTLYGFYLYAIEVPAGRYIISVTHEQWSGVYCYTLEVSDTPFVDEQGVPY